MRGSKAKAIRKYVRDTWPFLSTTPLYKSSGFGRQPTVTLAEQCQRKLYQDTKRGYKLSQRLNNIYWRKYNDK